MTLEPDRAPEKLQEASPEVRKVLAGLRPELETFREIVLSIYIGGAILFVRLAVAMKNKLNLYLRAQRVERRPQAHLLHAGAPSLFSSTE